MTTLQIFADFLFDRNPNNAKSALHFKVKASATPWAPTKGKNENRDLLWDLAEYSLLSASPVQGTHHHTEPSRSAQGDVEAPPVRHEAHVSAAISAHQTQDDDFTLAAYLGAMAIVHEDLVLIVLTLCNTVSLHAIGIIPHRPEITCPHPWLCSVHDAILKSRNRIL